MAAASDYDAVRPVFPSANVLIADTETPGRRLLAEVVMLRTSGYVRRHLRW